MTSFYDQATAALREEHHRLLSLRIGTPTDEQIEKTRGEYTDYQPGASLELKWEPLSYRIEGGPFGNVEQDRVPVTKSIRIDGNLIGLLPDELAAVRENGWLGLKDAGRVNQAKVRNLPRGKKTSDPYARLMKRMQEAGVDISIDFDGTITGTPGQIYSKHEGQVFLTESGMDNFGLWDPTANRGKGGMDDEGRQKYMRYPVKLAADYVQPEDVPVQIRTATAETTGEAAPTTATSGGVDVAKLREAADIMGMVGADASDFDGADKQRALVAKAPAKGAVIFGALGGQASEGRLVDFLVEVGALTVEDGVLA